MERRQLIKLMSGGFVAGLVGGNSIYALGQNNEVISQSSKIDEPKIDDWHPELTQRIVALDQKGGGTLELGDGAYEISKTLEIPNSVSLIMTPNATIRAKVGFVGSAVISKGNGKSSEFSHTSGWIKGGVIDGNKQPLTGIRVEGKCSRLEIADIVVLNCTYKGIHLLRGGYEANISRVRCDVDTDTRYAKGSIGIHYERHDSMVYFAHIIGYETGFRTDGNTSYFTGIHVWNNDANQGPMLYNFYCNGAENTFSMCYSDSPTIAGFYIAGFHNSVIQSRIYYSRWAKDNSGVGIMITPVGKHGNYIGNVFYASPEHRLAKAFDGDLEGATILANTSCYISKGGTMPGGVVGGFVNRIPSGESVDAEGNSFGHVPLLFGGTGFRMTQQAKAPTAQEGEIGEVRWVDDGSSSALWVKTTKGWKKSKLT